MILHLSSMPPGKSDAEDASEEICYECIRKGLDAVRVPLGICFKPSKLSCRTQLKHCLECASFCSSRGNEDEYREDQTGWSVDCFGQEARASGMD